MKKTITVLTFALCFAGCKKVAQQPTPVAETSTATSNGQLKALANGDPFTVVLLPDTQYYMDEDSHGGLLAMFTKQIDWIITTKTSNNIAYVGGLGDIVDDPTITTDWDQAKTQYARLTTAGVNWGVSVGNHDQNPYGNPAGSSTTNYNARFGRNYFHNSPWYGGNYAGVASNNNDSHYDFFTAGGIDFIVIHVEFDDGQDNTTPPVLPNQQATDTNDWVDGILATYPSRKAIIITHSMVNSSALFSTQGKVLYERIKARTNVFMMYGGHFYNRKHRSDTYNGNTINSYLCDYQDEPLGGDGYMRILKFRPTANQIDATSYSPYASNEYTTAEEKFTFQMFTNPYVYPQILGPTADAHVRSGTYADTNIGTAAIIAERNSTVAGSSYKSYLKFDLTAVTTPIVNAKLRVYGNASVTGTAATTFNCFGTTDAWTETGITWNNAPAAVGSVLGSNWINTLNKFREFDVTAYVQAQKTADNTASFQLTATDDILCSMYSKENAATANRPQLLIYH
jgi:hypothetical protein